MNQKVSVTLQMTHVRQGQGTERITQTVPGTLTRTPEAEYDTLFLDFTDEEHSRHQLRITPVRTVLDRSGTSTAQMTFEAGQVFKVPYRTPYGDLMLAVETLQYCLEDAGESRFVLTADYVLYENGQTLSQSVMRIEVREA